MALLRITDLISKKIAKTKCIDLINENIFLQTYLYVYLKTN